MSTITLRNVEKSYGGHAAVIHDLSLDIGHHEFCVFLGPSGCGKSTLLRVIAGLEDATKGELLIDGQRMNDVPAAQRGIAMVFQSYALFPHMTVFDNMAFGLRLAKQAPSVIQQKVRDAAAILQLDALLDRYPKALSGGQRQRVAIGRAIVREPGAFLFDEPLSNLDAALRSQTRIEIARLHRRFSDASVVYVTHDQIEAMTLADKVVLLRAGAEAEKHRSIAQCGAPLTLYHHPASRFVAGFIGSPRMNFLEATVENPVHSGAAGLSASGVALRLDTTGERLIAQVDGRRLQRGEPVTLGVRPEHLRLSGPDQALSCAVTLTERLGEHSYIHTDFAGVSFVAKAPGDTTVRIGENVKIHIPADACHVFDATGLALRRTLHETDLQAA